MSESKCPAVKAMAKREAWNRNGLAENCANRIAELERQLAEKDRQIEAMKSCYNCAWVSNDGSGCCQRPDNEYDTCISQKHWQAKEASGE